MCFAHDLLKHCTDKRRCFRFPQHRPNKSYIFLNGAERYLSGKSNGLKNPVRNLISPLGGSEFGATAKDRVKLMTKKRTDVRKRQLLVPWVISMTPCLQSRLRSSYCCLTAHGRFGLATVYSTWSTVRDVAPAASSRYSSGQLQCFRK